MNWLDNYNGDPKKKQPITVYDKKDPRLLAYNDSLKLFNLGEETYKQFKNITNKNKTTSEEADNYKNYYQKIREETGEGFVEPNERLFRLNNKMPKGILFTSEAIKDEKENIHYFSGERFKKPTQPVKYKKPDYWDTDKDVLAFRKIFKEKFNEEPSRDPNIANYDYDAAYKAGVRPVLDESDGLYHWSSEFKHDDHPNRFVNGLDTKTGKIQSKKGSFNQGKLAPIKTQYSPYNNTMDVLNMLKTEYPTGPPSFDQKPDYAGGYRGMGQEEQQPQPKKLRKIEFAYGGWLNNYE